jgi:hypothetical protein
MEISQSGISHSPMAHTPAASRFHDGVTPMAALPISIEVPMSQSARRGGAVAPDAWRCGLTTAMASRPTTRLPHSTSVRSRSALYTTRSMIRKKSRIIWLVWQPQQSDCRVDLQWHPGWRVNLQYQSGHSISTIHQGKLSPPSSLNRAKKIRNANSSLLHTFRTPWEIHLDQPVDSVGANMAEFAIGSLSTMASKNPRIQLEGSVPHIGSRIVVSWRYLIALFACIAGVHFTLALAAYLNEGTDQSLAHILGPLGSRPEDLELGPTGTVDGTGGAVDGERGVAKSGDHHSNTDTGSNSISPPTSLHDRCEPQRTSV